MIYIVATVLAFISILYEFCLAQLVTIFYGSTFTVYAFTIGLFTFSLGMGAFAFNKLIKRHTESQILVSIELLLSFFALLSPFFIIVFSAGFVLSGVPFLSFLVAFAPVLICGFLSGVELPCLMAVNRSKEDTILFDYIGMFLGAVLFGVLILDFFGPIRLIWLLSISNALVLLLFEKIYKIQLFFRIKLLAFLLMLVGIVLFVNENQVLDFFRSWHGF